MAALGVRRWWMLLRHARGVSVNHLRRKGNGLAVCLDRARCGWFVAGLLRLWLAGDRLEICRSPGREQAAPGGVVSVPASGAS
jgi:hypothetical protein